MSIKGKGKETPTTDSGYRDVTEFPGRNPTHLRQGRKSYLKTSSSQNKRYISFLALYTPRIIDLPPDFVSPLTLNNGGLIYTLNKESNYSSSN